jgi:hypothetical protein
MKSSQEIAVFETEVQLVPLKRGFKRIIGSTVHFRSRQLADNVTMNSVGLSSFNVSDLQRSYLRNRPSLLSRCSDTLSLNSLRMITSFQRCVFYVCHQDEIIFSYFHKPNVVFFQVDWVCGLCPSSGILSN